MKVPLEREGKKKTFIQTLFHQHTQWLASISEPANLLLLLAYSTG